MTRPGDDDGAAPPPVDDFASSVLDVVDSIPPGRVMSYGDIAEYLAAATPEARLVKACDKLQMMIKVTVYERWGEGSLAEFWDNPDNFPDLGFAPVAEIFGNRSAR